MAHKNTCHYNFLSLGFSTLSEFILLDAGIIVSLIIIFFYLLSE